MEKNTPTQDVSCSLASRNLIVLRPITKIGNPAETTPMGETIYQVVSNPADGDISRQRHPQHRYVVIACRHLVGIVIAAFLVGIALTAQLKSRQRADESLIRKGTHDSLLAESLYTPPSLNTTDNGPSPGVVWLMSFPNSGTSFTLKMVRLMSKRLVATNYGEENTDESGNSIPVYPNRTNGPFWIDPEGPIHELPSTFVLTKTHCGGRCEKCGPSKYIESPHSFLVQCLSGTRIDTSYTGVPTRHSVTYSPDVVKKAVHLIRNPFDNVVSRFHLEVHRYIKQNDTARMAAFPSSREGFRNFCRALDQTFGGEERSSRLVDPKVLATVKHVPCHADFFRYVQWHNLAFITTEDLIPVPTHVLHYENYSTNFNETVLGLLEFLDLEWRGNDANFIAGKEYSEYFLPEERKAMKTAMEVMSSQRTWRNVHHYFD